MQLRPVKASGFTSVIPAEERTPLMKTGITPVNDIFWELWEACHRIWLLFGGRGGGKSEAVFDRQLKKALTDDYMQCYYGRKIYDTVHDSCFKTLVASIEKLGLENEFKYSTADSSTMVVKCRHNKNMFIPFGADKPDKMKSIKDPSCLIMEEFDQFSFLDLQSLFPSLRTIKAKCELFAMFNTKDVLPHHWLLQVFFPDQYVPDADNAIAIDPELLQDFDVKKIFANYYDNYFIDQKEYYSGLRFISAGNKTILDGIANGAWGVIDNNNPWLYAFDSDKHVRPTPWLPQLPVYLSFDINADPIACTAYQYSDTKGHSQSFIHVINEFGGHIKVDDICQRIKTTYPQTIFFVTGDRSGQNEDVGRNQTIYQMIQSLLNLSDKQMNLNTHNLEHPDSRTLCNTMFCHYPRLSIDPKCKTLIEDCQKAKPDPKCPRPSQLYKNRLDGYKMDYFDSMRYFFQTYFNDFAKKAYFGILK